MKIKVCGMRHAENIEQVGALPIHFMGFIFYEKSPRCVKNTDDILTTFPADLTRVGVFVNADIDFVLFKTHQFDLNAVQLHGSETPQYIEDLSKEMKAKLKVAALSDVEIIKAFPVGEDFDFEELKPYTSLVNYFLFDTKTPNHGGAGVKFDWNILKKYDLDVPFLLAGGISEQDAKLVNSLNINQLYALDLNSKFEIEAGLKDVKKLHQFILELDSSHTN